LKRRLNKIPYIFLICGIFAYLKEINENHENEIISKMQHQRQ